MSTDNKCPHCERYYNIWHGSKPYCPTCDSEIGQMKRALEASQARVREQQADKELLASQNITLHRQRDQAEARVAVLREALKASARICIADCEHAECERDARLSNLALSTLDPAAERLLAERKLLRDVVEIAESLKYSGPCSGCRNACRCAPCCLDRALTALHEFDDKETK